MPGIIDFRTELEDQYGNNISATNPLPVTASGDAPVVTNPENITTKFRDAFETFVNGVNWDLVQASGDVVQIDGNTASASYLVISKDPLTANGETTLTSTATFKLPVEFSVGLSMSQRTLGQEFSMEFISTETPATPPADLQIASITQTTTTLTVTTVLPHGLVPGKRIGIRDCVYAPFNYPALVVNTTPSTTQFTCTAGPGGTITSLTIGPFTSGYVFYRSTMGYAPNGISEIFENPTVTNASVYFKSAGGDSLPSGTIAGNQSLAVGSTASVQAVVSPLSYSFQPTTEFRMSVQADRAQVYDSGVDSVTAQNNRILRTQVVPDSTKQYKLRFRFWNSASMTRPVAQIVSVAKSGTTTATITTDVPHNLTTNDLVNTYGVRDQTNFANLTSATTVASVINSTQFTVVWGTAVTATSYAGAVYRVNGSNNASALGALPSVVQSLDVTNGILTLNANANWAPVIGDYVQVIGCRDISTGASIGVDGSYRVRNVSTKILALEPIGTTTLPTTIALVNCGGAVMKRTDARISFVRVFDYLRERVEVLNRPLGDSSAAVPIQGSILNTVTAAISSGTITTVNQIAGLPANTMPYDSQHNLWANSVRRAVS